MPEQKPRAKIPFLQQQLLDEVSLWKEQAIGLGAKAVQQLFGLAQGWEKHRNIVQNNYELGCRHLALGNIRDAVLRFKMVTWLDPKHADGWYKLGCAYMGEGKPGLARGALARSLELRPGNEEADYMMAIAGGRNTPVEKLPKKMPLALAQQYFDRLASRYTQDQINTHRYQGHKLLTAAIHAGLTAGRIDHVVLELGVGTGLCGPLMRDVSSRLTGVDISQPMLEEAVKLQDSQGKKIYDELIKRDAHDFLREGAPGSYDIVMAAGLFSYIGDVSEMYAQAARVLKSGGIFAFTVDKMEGEGFRLDTAAGRFLFSKSYLEVQAAANKFKVMKLEEVPIYPRYDGWVGVLVRQ